MARLLFFGKIADIAGAKTREELLPDGAFKISDLIDAIGLKDEALAAALREETVRFVVNEQMVSGDVSISNDDEVAFFAACERRVGRPT